MASSTVRCPVVLLSCGSFNPVTFMHLRMFEIAKDHLQKTGYTVIGGIICPVNDNYGKQDLQPASHRNEMVRLSIKDNDWLRLSTWETEQESWTTTVKSLRHHHSLTEDIFKTKNKPPPEKKRKFIPDTPNSIDNNNYCHHKGKIQLMLLCGADVLESFAVPNLWADEDIEEIVNDYGIVCISRSGSNPEKFIYESDVLSKYDNFIHIAREWFGNEMSATKIR